MANMFNEDGTYNKTEWKAGDKITAVKLNKIELSLEAINNNDIDRHVEADSRLYILEERMANTPDNEQMDALEDMVKDNKDEVDLALYSINQNIETLESVNVDSRGRLDALEGVNADSRLDALEGVNADSRLDNLEEKAREIDILQNRTSGFVSLLEFGAIGDGVNDDTNAFQNAINSCLSTLGGANEINVIRIPPGKYKITSTITTYPQIKLVADGFVQLESYIVDGTVIYLRYPENMMHLKCDYRGKPINGNGNGFLIKNMLYTGEKNNGDTETEGVFGGNNTALELGTRESDDDTFSDARMVSRYNLEDILIFGFKTGMQINAISHFMGHYTTVRIKFADTCVQIGEYLGQSMGTSHENFNFDSCLFERSNNVVKWLRNNVGLVFNNSSFDFIRDNLLISKVSGSRRIIFNNGHIEKIKNYLYFGDFESGWNAINTVIKFSGVELHLKYGQLFKSTTKVLVNFDSCIYHRDEYYTEGYPANAYLASGKKMGNDKVYFDKLGYAILEEYGSPVSGLTNVTNFDFSMTDVVDLRDKPSNYITGFSDFTQEGAMNGTFSIVDFTDELDGWDIAKQIRFQISPTTVYGYFTLTTNKLYVRTLRTSVSFMVKCNDYNLSSANTIVKCYDYNDVLLETISQKNDHFSDWAKSVIPNEWCLYSTALNTGTMQLKPQTAYITITIKLETRNPNSVFNFTNILCDFN